VPMSRVRPIAPIRHAPASLAAPRPGSSGFLPARSALLSLLAAVLVGSATLVAAPTDVAADGTALPASVTFHGRGYGHGVGMSQYGARGRALAGQLAPQILAHYYAKTTLGRKNMSTNVRVMLLTGFAASPTKPVAIVGRRGTWTIDGIALIFPPDARAAFTPTAVGATTWNVRVRSSAGSLLHSGRVGSNAYVRPTTSKTVLELSSKASAMNVYRGFLRLRLTTTALVINHVPLDRYLRGVVPLEMPSSWPAEALKVQAIAARSYAFYRLHPTVGSYDLYDDTRSQVYRGVKAETAAANAAIAATPGTVVMSGTTVANTMFHSAAGGWTENNENVYVSSTGAIVAGPLPYLRGSSDRAADGSAYDKSSPYATWKTATYSVATLSAIFAKDPRTNVGTLSAMDLSRRGVSGRLMSVTLTGSLGTKTVSGEGFRKIFNAGRPTGDPMMRSTLVDTAPIP
jgi:stage II sporulation protein D